MGLFSGKKKTKVYTSVVRVIEDSQIPDSTKASVLKAIIRDQNMVDHIIDGLNQSIAVKAERMYEYAKKNYAYGLPQSSFRTNIDGQDVVRKLIEKLEGVPVTIDYFQYAPPNSLHIGWQRLVEQYGYVASSNELTVLSAQQGVPVYLANMVAVYTQETFDLSEPGSLDQWGTSPLAGYTPARPLGALGLVNDAVGQGLYRVDPSATEDSVEVTYVFQVAVDDTGKSLREGTLSIPLTGFVEEDEYYQVKYRVGTQTRYWTYKDGSDTYPEIDAIQATDYSGAGSYFPFAYVRHDKTNRTEDRFKDTAQYKTTKKMLKYISMDYDSVSESIHANPDIGDIEQALMVWAVPANTSNETERRYLFEYFNLLYYASSSPYQLTGSLKEGLGDFTRRGSQSIRISDKEFTMTFGFQGIAKRRVAGRIGKVGSHSSHTGHEVVIEQYEGYGENGREPKTREVQIPFHSYQRQVNDAFYDEIRVISPRLTYHIWSKYNVVASGGDSNLLIPLDHAITDLFSLPDREELYSRSLHFVMNTRVTTKEKWYQSGIFKAVMVIVAIVVSFFFPPGGAAMWAGIAAMGVAVYLVAIIVVTLLIGEVVGYVIKRVAEALGAEWAMVLAIAMIAYGGYRGVQAGLTLTQTAGTFIVKIGTNLVQASVAEHMRANAEALNKKTGEFELLADAKMKELEEVQKLLDVDSWLSPFEFIGEEPLIVWGEKPDDLYNRTVHSGNIGMAGIEMINSYVDAALTLPKMNNTTGDTFYV